MIWANFGLPNQEIASICHHRVEFLSCGSVSFFSFLFAGWAFLEGLMGGGSAWHDCSDWGLLLWWRGVFGLICFGLWCREGPARLRGAAGMLCGVHWGAPGAPAFSGFRAFSRLWWVMSAAALRVFVAVGFR